MIMIMMMRIVYVLLFSFTVNSDIETVKRKRIHHENPNRDHHNLQPGVNIGIETGNLPSVFILGCQKGGSSSLFEFMKLHPQLCGSRKKEPQFFPQLTEYALGKAYYESYFTADKCDIRKRNRTDTMFMDGTTMLHHYQDAIPRIAEFYYDLELRSKLKFIVTLREPVSRDISWYKHLTRYLLADGNNFTLIETMYERYDDIGHNNNDYSGKYVEQLDFITKFFNRSQLLVLNSEDLFYNSTRVMRSIQRFLKIDYYHPWYTLPFPHDDHLSIHANVLNCVVSHVPPIDCKIIKVLRKYYKPYNDQLYDWLNKTFDDSPPSQQKFKKFKKDPLNITCVEDSRAITTNVIFNDSQIGLYNCSKND